MRMVIEIEMDNAAFQDGNRGRETARILREIAQTVKLFGITKKPQPFQNNYTFSDINGNKVGTVQILE